MKRFSQISQPLLESVSAEEKEEWLLKARILVYTHTFLYSGRPANFIAMYLDKGFWPVYQRHCGSKLVMAFRVSPLVLIALALPWVYGMLLMPNPCKATQYDIDGAIHEMHAVKCGVQNYMKSLWAFTIAPLAGLVLLAVKLISDCNKWLIVGRNILQMLTLAFVGPLINKLKYQPYSTRGLPFNAVCGMYVAILCEFVLVAIAKGSNVHITKLTHTEFGFDPVAVVVGYAIGRIFLSISNFWIRPKGLLVQMIDAELSLAVGELFMKRLFDHTAASFWAKMEDLNFLHDIPKLREDVIKGKLYRYGGDPDNMRHAQVFEGTLAEQFQQLKSPIKKVFVPDHLLNLVIDVVSGSVLPARFA